MALTQVQPGMLGTPQPYNFKNRLINGQMQIDQRNAGASVNNSAGYTFGVDRWQFYGNNATKYSFQQSSTAPAGFSTSTKITSLAATSVGASDIYMFRQQIEGYNIADLNFGSANAKTVTLSFWVNCSLTGTFGGSITNKDSVRSYPFTYTISSANTWEQKSITIAGDTSGTWQTTNDSGLQVWLGLGVGSTYSGTAGSWATASYWSATGATNFVSTSGATFYITGVQLEVGSTATGFDYRPYTTELQLCQRYCWVSDPECIVCGTADGNTTVWARTLFPVIMRTAPSSITASGSIPISDDFASDYTNGSPTVDAANTSSTGGRFRITGFSGLTVGRQYFGLTSSGKITFSAEL